MATKVRMLPQNIEAEAGVLGSILIDPEALDRVVGFLQAEDFYRDAHRVIYETIEGLMARSIKADFLTLTDELERRGKLEAVGGAAYITSLINAVPTSGNIAYYGRIVERTGVLRRLIQAAGEIAASAYEEEDVQEALASAEQKIFALSQRFVLAQRSDVTMSELMTSYMALIEQRYANRGVVVGVPSGFTDLDRLTGGFQKSDLIILAARPSVGKTALALNMAYNAAILKKKVGFFSLEMGREQLAGRLVSRQSGVDQQRLRTGLLEDEDWQSLVRAMEMLAATDTRIDDTAGISLLQMQSRLRRWVAEYGIEIVFVDYLQLITTGQHVKAENRQLEVSLITRELKRMARELNIPVVALAQLSRAVEQRQSKLPQLSDLRESGSLENDADVVMLLYREELYEPETERRNQIDVLVAKQRNGPLGEVVLRFDKARSKFEDLEVLPSLEDDEVVVDALDEADESDEPENE